MSKPDHTPSAAQDRGPCQRVGEDPGSAPRGASANSGNPLKGSARVPTAAYTDSKSAPEGAAHHGAEVEGPAGEEPVASSSGDADDARQSSSPAAFAAQDRELDGLRKLYGQKFNAIGAALGHATEAQDKLEAGDEAAAMEEIGRVVSILVDA